MAIKASVVSAGAILRAEVDFGAQIASLAVSAGNAMTILTLRRHLCRFALNAMVV